MRFTGGTSEIPLRLTEQLKDHIVLNAPVQLIEHSDDSVTVSCRGGVVATGKQVIVALAPTLAGRIMYDPPLPGVRDQLTQRLPQASAMKRSWLRRAVLGRRRIERTVDSDADRPACPTTVVWRTPTSA